MYDPRIVTVAGAVLRRLVPQLVEATLIPSALCYLGVLTFGLLSGVIAATSWAVGSIIVRSVRGRRIPVLLVLTSFGFLLRLGLYLASSNDFVYFVQPVIRTFATALLFVGSAVIGRPLVARFAGDYCSFASDVGSRPAITALFRRLTYLWAAGQMAIAAATLTLLLTVPVTVFIGTAAGVAWASIITCLLLTVVDAVRTTRREGVRTVLLTGGRLMAVAPALPVGLPTMTGAPR